MKMTKKKALFAVFAVAVVALAGVGYAAVTNYTATTSSTDNTIGSEYSTIKLYKERAKTNTAYTGLSISLEYSSNNNGGDITYTMNGSAKTIEIHAFIKAEGVDASQKYNLSIDATDFFELNIPCASLTATVTGVTGNMTAGGVYNTTSTFSANEEKEVVLTLTVTPDNDTPSEDEPDTNYIIDEIAFTVTAFTE